MLKIQDVYTGSRIQGQQVFLTKKLFLSSRKNDVGCSSRIPGPDFFPFRIPESKKHRITDPDPQHCNKTNRRLINSYLLYSGDLTWSYMCRSDFHSSSLEISLRKKSFERYLFSIQQHVKPEKPLHLLFDPVRWKSEENFRNFSNIYKYVKFGTVPGSLFKNFPKCISSWASFLHRWGTCLVSKVKVFFI